eukprot:scaffold185702_cov14-Prasinocladus_malaysianus.AAC.1
MQLPRYLSKDGLFRRAETTKAARSMAACEWWDVFGNSAPELQLIAKRCLAQIAGATAAEREHKVMNFMKTKSRNRLGSERTRWKALDFIGSRVPVWTTDGDDENDASDKENFAPVEEEGYAFGEDNLSMEDLGRDLEELADPPALRLGVLDVLGDGLDDDQDDLDE